MTDLTDARLDELEALARRDDWHRTLVGSDVRALIAEVRRLRAALEDKPPPADVVLLAKANRMLHERCEALETTVRESESISKAMIADSRDARAAESRLAVEVAVLRREAGCVDPAAGIAFCANCEKAVHLCERKAPVGTMNDYRCPAHPDGAELSDGTWVCSAECGEALE